MTNLFMTPEFTGNLYIVHPRLDGVDRFALLEEFLQDGLRIGPGLPNLPLDEIGLLENADGKSKWVDEYMALHPDHSPETAESYWSHFRKILDLEPGSLVVLTNVPTRDHLCIARIEHPYRFDSQEESRDISPHVIPLAIESGVVIEKRESFPDPHLASCLKRRGGEIVRLLDESCVSSFREFLIGVNADTGTIIGLDDLTESMGSSDDDLMDGESSDMSYGDDGASTDDGGGDTGTIEWMSTFARHNGFGRDRTGGGETAGMIRVWYGTNRKPTGNSAEYRWERHSRDDGNPIITYGHLDVNIPRSHRLGEIGNPLWRRLLRGELKSDRLEITDRAMLEEDRFWSSLRTSVSDLKEMADGDDVHAMVYIHGYNVTFDQAAIRAAQLGYDLKVPGPTAFFSWPSRGRTDSYLSDVASIEASVMAIKTFLSEFSIKSGADRIHLIIHSMGNRGVLRALSQLTSQLENEVQKPFRQIILAAPDVDSNEFQQLAAMLTRLCSRSTMYASRRDWAVWLSRIIHRHTRAGYFLPYTVAQGVDTIAVPSFNADLLGHSYYAEAHELLHDIFMLIHSDFAPQNRQRVFPLSIDGMRLWRLVR